MKNSYKIALLAAVGLASVSAVKADTYGDLLIGFTTGSGSDQLADIENIATLTSGESWTASQLGISASSVSSYSWGVVGDVKAADGVGSYGNTLFITSAGGVPPTTGNLNGVNPGITSLQNAFFGATGSSPIQTASLAYNNVNSWDSQTIGDAIGTDIGNSAGINPNVKGATSDVLWEVAANNSAPVELGTFTLSSGGTLTYEAASSSVPEPTTYGLIAGAGLLMVSLRNKFSRKQA